MPLRVKPPYRANPAHSPRAPLPWKTPEPPDAERVYRETAVEGDGVWYATGGNGQIYRFSPTNDGTVHFSGMTGGAEGIRFEHVPIHVRRALGRLR